MNPVCGLLEELKDVPHRLGDAQYLIKHQTIYSPEKTIKRNPKNDYETIEHSSKSEFGSSRHSAYMNVSSVMRVHHQACTGPGCKLTRLLSVSR